MTATAAGITPRWAAWVEDPEVVWQLELQRLRAELRRLANRMNAIERDHG